MPDEAPTSTNNDTNNDTGTAPETQTSPPAGTGDAKTPEWYEKELSKTRNEAAGYRTKLRDTEARLAGAKSQEDYDSAVAELKASNAKLERDLLVATVGEGLPADLRAVLKGDTEEELRAHAEVLKKYVPATGDQTPPPPSLQGGLDPTTDPDSFDPDQFVSDWRSGRIPRASVSGRTH